MYAYVQRKTSQTNHLDGNLKLTNQHYCLISTIVNKTVSKLSCLHRWKVMMNFYFFHAQMTTKNHQLIIIQRQMNLEMNNSIYYSYIHERRHMCFVQRLCFHEQNCMPWNRGVVYSYTLISIPEQNAKSFTCLLEDQRLKCFIFLTWFWTLLV